MHLILGYISLLFILLLMILYPLRVKYPRSNSYQFFLKNHNRIVLLILILSLIHGIMEGKKQGMISGKISWFILLLMGIVCLLCKKCKYRKQIHHIFMILFLLVIISHVVFPW